MGPQRVDVHRDMADRAAAAGLRRLAVLTFRDLEDPDAGGSELHVSHLCADLAAAGLDVTLRTGRVGPAPDELRRDGYRVVRRGGRVGVFPTAARDVRRGALGPIDGIVEVFHGIPFFAPTWGRALPQVAICHHVHLGTWRHLLPLPGAAVGHAIERLAVPLAYRRRPVVTISESSRDELVHAYRVRPDQVVVAPCGVDPAFSPGGSRSPSPLVVAVARLMPQKAVPDLVAAFARVVADVPEARLVVVGEGPARPEIEQAVAAHGLTHAVDLAGYVPEDALVDWYRRAWVVASASLREGYGLTLSEAGACATPAVARRIPGHVDAIEHEATGLLVDDVAGLADGLVRLLRDPDLRARMGTAAREHAETLRWDRAAQLTLDALCRDAERRR